MYLESLFSLADKTAVVAGGSRGLGRHIAVGLAKAGAEVYLFSRTSAQETVRIIESEGGKATGMLVDVTDEHAVEAALKTIFDDSGSLDVVFNNAGTCIHKKALDATIEEWRHVVDTNLTGLYIVARAAGAIMIENGIRGSIINMASMSGRIVNRPQGQASYNASKAGVLHMTRSLAVEWAPYGVRVNSLSPGYMNSRMPGNPGAEKLQEQWLPMIPLERLGNPHELIPAVLYLASPASGYTTGSDVVVDGAYSCC